MKNQRKNQPNGARRAASANRTPRQRPRIAPLGERYAQLKADFDELLAYNAILYRQVLALSALANVKPPDPPQPLKPNFCAHPSTITIMPKWTVRDNQLVNTTTNKKRQKRK